MNSQTDLDLDLRFIQKFLAASDTSIVAAGDGVVFKLAGQDFDRVKYPRKNGKPLRRKKGVLNG